MKKRLCGALALVIAFCVAFSGLPALAGGLEAEAVAKLPKKITLKATASGQTQIDLRWNKIKSPGKGYAVFRDDQPIVHLSKKTTSFSDAGLDPGSTHKYQIKTYTKKKATFWYNLNTGKWQKKKPAKKYRGKKTKAYEYKYKKKSSVVIVSTVPGPSPLPSTVSGGGGNNTGGNDPGTTDSFAAPGNVKCIVDNAAKKITVSWDAVPGATGYCVYREFNGKTQRKDTTQTGIIDADVSENVTYTYYVKAINGSQTSDSSVKVTGTITSQGSGGNDTPTTQTVTVTDYLGVTRTFTKKSNETSWTCTSSTDGRTGFGTSQMVRYDKNIDGTFKNNNNETLRTYHGATFNVTAIENYQPDDRTVYYYTVEMYNGDPSKLQLVLDSDVQILSRDTFEETGKYTYTPIKKYYYYKGGHPIGKTYDDGAFAKDAKETKSGYTINKKIFYINNSAMAIGDALGMWTDKFDVTVKYDGEAIGTMHIDTARDVFFGPGWTTDNCNGMSPFRRKALEIAQQALRVKGESGNLDTDLKRIDAYVKENYSYAEPISFNGTTTTMTCYFGAIIMETYSIYKFSEFGFEGSGSEYGTSNGKHSVFVLDKSPHPYYATQGTHDGQYDSDVGYF